MSIQQDILETIGPDGIEVGGLQKAVGNVGANELRCAVDALLRARRLQINDGRYLVVPSTRPLGGMPHTGRPPSAEEEAAQSLQPAQPVRFHSARKKTVNDGTRVSGEAPYKGSGSTPRGDNPGSNPERAFLNGSGGVEPGDGRENAPIGSPVSADTSSAASLRPVLANHVFERAQAKRREALNRLALLKVDVANVEMAIAECDRFLELYERFAQGGQ